MHSTLKIRVGFVGFPEPWVAQFLNEPRLPTDPTRSVQFVHLVQNGTSHTAAPVSVILRLMSAVELSRADLTRRHRLLYPTANLVAVLSNNPRPHDLRSFVGNHGMVCTRLTDGMDVMRLAASAAACGGIYISSSLASLFRQSVKPTSPLPTNTLSVVNLTQTELNVVELLLANPSISNKSIGEKLNVSDRTVANHLNKIFRLFGVGNRYELVAINQTKFSRTKSPVKQSQGQVI